VIADALAVLADALAVSKATAALLAEELIEAIVALPPPLPWAWTVIVVPAGVVLVAPARPAVVTLAESIAGELEDEDATSACACAPGRNAPPAATVITAGLVPFMTADDISGAIGDATALGPSTTDCILR
jgi:hypothetical protein